MNHQKTAFAVPHGARLYFPGHSPSGQLTYVELPGGYQSAGKKKRWIIPTCICDALWALFLGPFEPQKPTSRRR